ncbi:MAG: hypothetical protein KatS3mg033_0447 [Thermonema sp.]|uniref:EF-hand domain-containing protein n=1 Tax=Thermonema sp. TaxID=2231181 RepID=UPI0021DC37E5|nr:EF-hand domain-containing protein [Thermonema sp.]GIV38647.1 MAG: hypothetical protein KatS3mg033_0447 [Thermonema sp.]
MLSAFQRQKIEHLFRFYDQDKSGFIEAKDIDTIANRFAEEFRWRIGEEQDKKFRSLFRQVWRKLVLRFDENADEKVSPEEFLQAYTQNLSSEEAYQKNVFPFIEKLFPILDGDKDNAWTQKEFRRFYRCFGQSNEGADAAFEAMDLNGDGLLQQEEVFTHFRAFHLSESAEDIGNHFFGKLS